MPAEVPDIAGFRDAQIRLVDTTGYDVDFSFAPSAEVFASGTYIDPDTNLPLDPLIDEVSEVVFPTITARATLIRRPTSDAQGGSSERFGMFADGEMWLRLPTGEFDPMILRAAYCTAYGDIFRINRKFYDGIAASADTLYMQCTLTNAIDPDELTPMGSGVTVVGPFTQETIIATAGQTIFAVSVAFETATTDVYLNGVHQAVGLDYIESGMAVILNDPATVGDRITIAYMTG